MSDESLREEILINVTPSEVRAALLESGILQEVYIERSARRGVISNIYKGRVSRVLPGMQAAFVDIGQDKNAFLYAGDILADTSDFEFEKKAEHPNLAPKGIEDMPPSVLGAFLEVGVPGIHVTRIIDLAEEYGLEIAPRVTPEVGTGAVFQFFGVDDLGLDMDGAVVNDVMVTRGSPFTLISPLSAW